METIDKLAYFKFQQKMIKKAKKEGITENFGKKEIEQLKKKYGYNPNGTIDEMMNASTIDSLWDWCENLDLAQIKLF